MDKYSKHYDDHYKQSGRSGAGTNETAEKLKIWQSQGFNDSMSVLDYGCGVGVMAQFVDHKLYLGVDISPTAIDLALQENPNHTFEVIGLDEVPDYKADMVVAHSVFTHTPKGTGLDTIKKCLKGFAIIDVIHGEDNPDDLHVRRYTKTEWNATLKSHGLTGEVIKSVDWPSYTHTYYRVEHENG